MTRNSFATIVGALSLALVCAVAPGCGDDGDDDGTGGGGTTTSGTTTSGTTTSGTTTTTTTTTGTGATCETNICTMYGAAVPTVASDIVDEAAADPMFADDFADLVAQGQPAVDAFKTSLANFITDAYGCTDGAYTGPSMEDAHMGLGITETEYDAFIALIAGVLADNGVPEADINNCFAPPLVDPAFVSTIVGL